MMKDKTVREFIREYNIKNGWTADDDDDLMETLLDGSEHVETIHLDAHRWYIAAVTIVKLNGRYIKFDDYVITGDNSVSDMGLEYDLDSAKFVEKTERQITEIYYE